MQTERGTRVVGAGGCHVTEYSNLPAPTSEFVFVWFHPHYRRHGYLSQVWPQLTQRWGPFCDQHPLSPAIQPFLAKQPHEIVHTTDGKNNPVEFYR